MIKDTATAITAGLHPTVTKRDEVAALTVVLLRLVRLKTDSVDLIFKKHFAIQLI